MNLDVFITIGPAYFEAKTSIKVNMIYNNLNYGHHFNLNGGYRPHKGCIRDKVCCC